MELKSSKDSATESFPTDSSMSRSTAIIALFLTSALGFFLRIINISSFNIYPDSYIYLLMAKNMIAGSPVEYLGPHGMFYKLQFFWITRLGYLLLIVPFNLIFRDLEFSAHVVSFLAAILSVPLIYLLASKLFDSRQAGIISSFLLAISFTHVAWSGFVLAETTAIFFILTSLVFTAYSIRRESSDFGNLHDILAGIFAALSVITRCEYLLLILPLLFLVVVDSKYYWGKVVTFLSSFFVLLTAITLATPFMREQFGIAPNVFNSNSAFFVASIVLPLFLAVLIKQQAAWAKETLSILRKIVAVLIPGFIAYVYVQLIFGDRMLPYWSRTLAATRIFAQYEFLIVIVGVLGISYLLLSQEHSNIGFFALLYVLPPAVLYNRVNPTSYRYSINHLPVLIIAGSFLVAKLAKLIKSKLQKSPPKLQWLAVYATLSLTVFVSLLQIKTSAASMTEWVSEVSYEKKAAIKVAKIIEDKNIPKDTVLITFFFESYYIYTNKSTGGVYTEYPYLPMDDFPSNKPILIVVDEGLRDQRPGFVKFVEKNLSRFVIDKFWVGIPYYLEDYRKEESKPVTLYYISGKKFTNILGF